MGSLNVRSVVIFLNVLVLLSSCENDIKEVEKVSSAKAPILVDKSFGVEVIYSDSAVVKAKLLTPEVLNYKTINPYLEMTKGVTIIFYDEDHRENGRVTSDYAIRKENQMIVEFRKNVVVSNIKGDGLRSDEVIWDEAKGRFFSNKTVEVSFANGSKFNADGFWSDQDLYPFNFYQARGNINVPENEGF